MRSSTILAHVLEPAQDMRARDHLWVATAGIAIGTMSVLSPMTLWFGLAIIPLFAWGRRGLGERERRVLTIMLAVAVILRVTLICWLFLGADHSGDVFVSFPFDGDGQYVKVRTAAIRNVWLGMPIRDDTIHAFNHGFGWSSYLYVLGYLQFLIGPAPYGVHLFNAGLQIAGSVLLYRTMRRFYGPAVGLGGLAVMLFMPSLVCWSVTALKESLQFLLVATGLATTIGAWHAGRWRTAIGALAIAVLAIVATSTVRRDIGLALGLGGTAVGFLLFGMTRRVWLSVLVAAFMLTMGPAVLRQPAVQTRVLEVLRVSAVRQIGNVQTLGHGYKLLDQRFYSGDDIETMTAEEGYRYALRALASFVIIPTPWQMMSSAEIAFVPEQMLWYVLVLFAIIGVVPGLRRDGMTTCLLCGYVVVGAVAISLPSGNLGTFVRHRDIVTPFIVWLSALGAQSVLASLRARIGVASPSVHRQFNSVTDPACL